MSDPISMSNGSGSIFSIFSSKNKDKTKRLTEPRETEKPVPPDHEKPSTLDARMNGIILNNFGVINPKTMTGYGYGFQAMGTINENLGLGAEMKVVNFQQPSRSGNNISDPSIKASTLAPYTRFASWYSPFIAAGFFSGKKGVSPYVRTGPNFIYTITSTYYPDRGGVDTPRGLLDVSLSVGANVQIYKVKRMKAYCAHYEAKKSLFIDLYMELGIPMIIASSKTGRTPFTLGFGIDFGY
jgi:hypothetical protein